MILFLISINFFSDLKMELDTLANTPEIKNTVMDYLSIQMVQNMKVHG